MLVASWLESSSAIRSFRFNRVTTCPAWRCAKNDVGSRSACDRNRVDIDSESLVDSRSSVACWTHVSAAATRPASASPAATGTSQLEEPATRT